jgi:hypothetical protein
MNRSKNDGFTPTEVPDDAWNTASPAGRASAA